ncbi:MULTISPECIES: LytTR family transcriptional regulator DNA-binding domain-containing protein [unclassified Enterococcus]|uniref:LytTR family transcriptional regulator DNA-binding domain-containing protein n=1 Tax=unclassified Enterococcus TaxID=2608891 RepID=UPI003D2A6445
MNIYILEDNYRHRNYLTLKLAQLDVAKKYNIIVIENEDILDFYKHADSLDIKKEDIFLIDIDLNCLHTGIDIAEKIRFVSKNCFIVFISSDMRHGVEIINRTIRPFAYLSKQFQGTDTLESQLQSILNKVEKQIKKEDLLGEKIVIPMREEVEFIDLNELNYIETIKGNRYAVNVYYSYGTSFVNKSFSFFRKNINNDLIFMGLKSYIINTVNIKNINKKECTILFENLDSLYLGRKLLKKLLDFMEKNN